MERLAGSNGAGGAGVAAGTAVDAGTGVDHVLGVTLGNSAHGAAIGTSAAADAAVIDHIGHEYTPP